MSGRHRKPGRNPGPALAVAAATALIVPGLMAGTHASATETAMTRAAQPSWWHTAHVAHVARLARLGEAAIVTQAPGSRATSGKTWGVSYGYPNYCGDGDGDGWDVQLRHPLERRTAAAPAAQPVALARQAQAAANSASYSYKGLNNCGYRRAADHGQRPTPRRSLNASPAGTPAR